MTPSAEVVADDDGISWFTSISRAAVSGHTGGRSYSFSSVDMSTGHTMLPSSLSHQGKIHGPLFSSFLPPTKWALQTLSLFDHSYLCPFNAMFWIHFCRSASFLESCRTLMTCLSSFYVFIEPQRICMAFLRRDLMSKILKSDTLYCQLFIYKFKY